MHGKKTQKRHGIGAGENNMAKQGFDFPKTKQLKDALNIHIIIYVPSTKQADKPITGAEMKRRISETRRFIRNQLGGSTTVSGTGDWKDSGQIFTEDVAKVESFTTAEDYDKADLKIKKWLTNKKREWGQKSLSYEFEEQLLFV